MLAPRFGDHAFQLTEFTLQHADLLLRLSRQNPALIDQRVALGETARDFHLRIGKPDSRFDPLPDGQTQRQQRDDRPRTKP